MTKINSFIDHKEGTKQLLIRISGFTISVSWVTFSDTNRKPNWNTGYIADRAGVRIPGDHPEYRNLSKAGRTLAEAFCSWLKE